MDKKQEEGVCPSCGKGNLVVDYASCDLDGDGSERSPAKCPDCGWEGSSIRELVWVGYD